MAWQLTPEKFLAKEQVQKLTEVMRNAKDLALYRGGSRAIIKDYYIIQAFLFSGLRLSELISLNIEDLFLRKQRPCLIVRKGKGDKQRTVFLCQNGKNLLQEYLELRSQWNEPDTGVLFLSTRNSKYTPRGIQLRLKTWYQKAGLDYKKLGVHSLRHTYLTELLRTKNLNLVRNQAGHSSLLTSSVYLHLVSDDLDNLEKLYS